MIAPFFFLLLTSLFGTGDRNLNLLSSAKKSWNSVATLKNIDADLANKASDIFSNLTRIDELNQQLNLLRISCEVDVEPTGKSAIGAAAQFLARMQDSLIYAIEFEGIQLKIKYRSQNFSAVILNHYRQATSSSCNIPGNLKWAQSRVRAVATFTMENAGVCVYGGEHSSKWNFCHAEVIRHEA